MLWWMTTWKCFGHMFWSRGFVMSRDCCFDAGSIFSKRPDAPSCRSLARNAAGCLARIVAYIYSKVHRVAATTSLHLSTPQTLQLWCKYHTYRSYEVTCMFRSVGATFCTPILQFLQQISCVFSPLNFENGVRNQPLRSARKCRAEVNWSFFPLKQTNLLVLCRDYVENTL